MRTRASAFYILGATGGTIEREKTRKKIQERKNEEKKERKKVIAAIVTGASNEASKRTLSSYFILDEKIEQQG